jgi:uncharacterized protein (TIRG00374 family)
MNKTKQQVSRNLIGAIMILGLAAFIAYFYFFIHPNQVAEILLKTNLEIYAGAFISYFLFTFFSSLVWQQLLKNLAMDISVRKALLFTWVGLFFDTVVPQLGWSGEISKTYLLAKDTSEDPSKIGATTVGQKIFTITLTITALSAGLLLILVSYPLPFLYDFFIIAVLALSILTLLILYYVSVKPSATKTLLSWGIKIGATFKKKWNPNQFQDKAEGFLSRFHLSMKQLTANPRALIKPIIFAMIGFVFEFSVISFSFLALGYSVPIDKVLIVFTLTGTLQTVGITVFGFTEIAMTSIFTLLGIPVDLSFSVTLLTRVVSLWFRFIVSYGALQLAGIQLITRKPRINQSTKTKDSKAG